LSRCPELRQETTTFWNWVGPRKLAEAISKQKRKSKSHTFATTLDDGSLALGGLEVKGRTLVLSVNSQDRSERGRPLLSNLLGELVGEPLVEMQTLDQIRAQNSPPS